MNINFGIIEGLCELKIYNYGDWFVFMIFFIDGKVILGVIDMERILWNIINVNIYNIFIFVFVFGREVDYIIFKKIVVKNFGFVCKIFEDVDVIL